MRLYIVTLGLVVDVKADEVELDAVVDLLAAPLRVAGEIGHSVLGLEVFQEPVRHLVVAHEVENLHLHNPLPPSCISFFLL